MDRPEITVTMPAFNRADLIVRAIESVQSQTLKSWELVIVDDGSTGRVITPLDSDDWYQPSCL